VGKSRCLERKRPSAAKAGFMAKHYVGPEGRALQENELLSRPGNISSSEGTSRLFPQLVRPALFFEWPEYLRSG